MSGELVGEDGAPSEGKLRADVTLEPELRFDTLRATRPVNCVLLTGATGFLGANLAHDLLLHSELEVCCLVRADGVEAARARVQHSLTEQQLWRPEFAERLTIVPGDLAAPRFGLGEAEFDHLGERCDAVLH